MKECWLCGRGLRDGCQAEDVSFTLEDKLRIAEKLEELGIDYIEGGYPGSNQRDADFFKQVKKLKLKDAKIASFGTTRKPGAKASQDLSLKLLLSAAAPVVTLVGKTWDLHVRDDLRISKKANLDVIFDSISYVKKHTDEVIFDAEHFFDGCGAGGGRAGAGNHQRAGRALRQRQSVLADSESAAQAGVSVREPGAVEEARPRVPVRVRAGESGAAQTPALRGRERVRPQGGAPRRGRAEKPRDVRARGPGAGG